MRASALLLTDEVRRLEEALTAADLGLQLLDRVGALVRCAPDALLHRGVNVRPIQSANRNQYRDEELARVRDVLQVELAYELAPTAQRASRDEALVLEEQVRKLLTGTIPDLKAHVRYESTPSRVVHPNDGGWYIITQNFTIDRDAVLGG